MAFQEKFRVIALEDEQNKPGELMFVVELPDGTRVQEKMLQDMPVNHMNKMTTLKVLFKEGSVKACCIVHANRLWCWC